MRSRIAKLERRFPTISRRTGISVERLEEIGAGANSTLDELLALSKYLRVPIDALSDLDDVVGRSDMRLRATSQPDLYYAAETRVNLICEFILSCVDKERNISIEVGASVDSLRSVDDSSLVVRGLLDLDYSVDPIYDIAQAISDSNICHVIKLYNFGIDGASVSVNGVNFIFVSAQYVPRMRFTIAHELAHIVFGHCKATAILDEEIGDYSALMREDERLANAFASCLLLPAVGVTRFLSSFKRVFEQSGDSISSIEISYISRFFGASFEVAGNRLEQLRIISKGATEALVNEIRKDFDSPEAYMKSLPPKPNYRDIPVISPRLRAIVGDRIRSGDISISRFANVFGYSVNDAYAVFR